MFALTGYPMQNKIPDNDNPAAGRIAVFASGNGSNAQRLAEYFAVHGGPEIAAIYCNNPHAFVIERARNLNIPVFVFDRKTFYNSEQVLEDLEKLNVDWIILAGFLWLIPGYLLRAYEGKIINIHPALLPKYGGSGMYGVRVHEAVIASGDSESGISIHYVNEKYDEGQIIFQAKCPVEKNDTPETLAQKIHALEYAHFPVVVSDLVMGRQVSSLES
jgi:phosphoribosylglycinamide formyltransferase 1